MVSSFKSLNDLFPKHLRIYDSTSHRMPHNIYSFEVMQNIKITHLKPKSTSDKMARLWMKALKPFFNTIMRYNPAQMTEQNWINYLTLIETFTGVTGMVGGMSRHLQSLRLMKHDNGWIHRLLEQADNERFHLMMFVNMKKPSYLARIGILVSQAVFMTSFFSSYLFFPKYSHRFVGYFEQTLVEVYSELLEQIDKQGSPVHQWESEKASKQTAQYYHMDVKTATVRDIMLAIRADKANHRQTNHFFAQVPRDIDIEEQQVRIINEKEVFTIKKQ